MEIPETNIIDSIQDTSFEESKVGTDMIETANYYEVLNDETSINEEANNQVEYDYADTGYELEDYYDDHYYTEFYNDKTRRNEVAMAAQHIKFQDIDKQTWLGDTGASAHMTNSLVGMINIRKNKTKVTVGSGEQLPAPKIGDKVGYVTRVDRTEQKVILKDTKYVPGMNVNLMSLTTAMNQGYELIGKKET